MGWVTGAHTSLMCVLLKWSVAANSSTVHGACCTGSQSPRKKAGPRLPFYLLKKGLVESWETRLHSNFGSVAARGAGGCGLALFCLPQSTELLWFSSD